jgi:hypothetical protein
MGLTQKYLSRKDGVMVTPEKRSMSARQLLSDIQAGMDGEQPSQKHGLSDRSLKSVLHKLAVPYRLWLFPSNMGGIRFYPTCYWPGQFELSGNTYKVVTFDGNAEGDHSNDPVVIDLDNDGKAADSERLKPGQSLTIDGREVRLIAIAPSGRWIRVQY